MRFKTWSSCSHGTGNDSVVHSVRFGSKADMCSALGDDCYGPNVDIEK